jgi:hypothetical protein
MIGMRTGLIKKNYLKTLIASNSAAVNRLQQQQKFQRRQPSTSMTRATSEKGARDSRTSATSETLVTADTTATTKNASIIKDNNVRQHSSSSWNASISREVRNEGRKHYDIVMQATTGMPGTA